VSRADDPQAHRLLIPYTFGGAAGGNMA